jgi:hypothetical protein
LKPVADLHLQLLRPGAKRKSLLHVNIGSPQPDGDSWYCPIRLKGLVDKKEHRIFGVDSWQALTLALRFVEVMLRHEVREGGQLFFLGHKTSVGQLFASRIRG